MASVGFVNPNAYIFNGFGHLDFDRLEDKTDDKDNSGFGISGHGVGAYGAGFELNGHLEFDLVGDGEDAEIHARAPVVQRLRPCRSLGGHDPLRFQTGQIEEVATPLSRSRDPLVPC